MVWLPNANVDVVSVAVPPHEHPARVNDFVALAGR
jgi:hypothetical protein